MNIIDRESGKTYSIEILAVKNNELEAFQKDEYFFDWIEEKNQEVYKLKIVNSSAVLGLISIERIPEEWRIHIRLLCVSRENKGKTKKYENIVGNLLTHVAKIAVLEYGELACISLRPKTKIAQHYITKFKMNITGATLSLEVPEILNLINVYDHE